MRKNILIELEQEHREFEFLISEIKYSQDISKRKELFLELEAKLFSHLIGEERVIYSRIKLISLSSYSIQIINEADHDHQKIKRILDQLNQTSIENPGWYHTFQSFCDIFNNHIKNEERILFPIIHEDFSEEELFDFLVKYEKERNHVSPWGHA